MTPAEESAYLRELADEIAADERLSHRVRLTTTAILTARADHLDREARA